MSNCFTISPEGACTLGGLRLHPPENALQAAHDDLAGMLEDCGPEDILVLAGVGLGWHAKAVMETKGAPRLVAFEPDPRRQALRQCLGPHLPGLNLALSAEELCEKLGQWMVYEKPGKVRVFCPQAYCRLEPEVEGAARELVDRTLSRHKVNQTTRQVRSSLWLENIAYNFNRLTQCPDLTLLAGAMAGEPALVVGAGPSLDQSLEALPSFKGKAMIMAAASALGPLAGVGIAPEAAFALETKDESRQFKKAEPDQTIMCAATCGHPNHFSQWAGFKSLFHLQPWMAKLIGLGSALSTGGHATSAAFSLALLWGCDPIILVGQDLAFTNGRMHASGRPGGEDYDRPDTVLVPAIGKGRIQTSEVMMSYITWYQEAAGYLRRKHPGRRVINATAQGAYIPGFEHLTLEQAFEGMPPMHLAPGQLIEVAAGLPRPGDSYLAQRIAQARSQLRSGLGLLGDKGLAALLADAPKDTALSAALEGLTEHDHASKAENKLAQWLDHLNSMAERLYG